MSKDTLNVWFSNDIYHIRYDGKHYRYNNYIEAKQKVDSIMQSVYFTNSLDIRKAA